jgi:hypothetical protein
MKELDKHLLINNLKNPSNKVIFEKLRKEGWIMFRQTTGEVFVYRPGSDQVQRIFSTLDEFEEHLQTLRDDR